MKSLDWLLKGVFFWLSMVYHLQSEDVIGTTFYPCVTSDRREGVCVTREHCQVTDDKILLECSDDTYCCDTESTSRGTEPPYEPLPQIPAGVHGLTTDECLDEDGYEGLCVASKYCRHATNKSLVSCGQDVVCCTFQASFRGVQPSWDSTTKAPIHGERETEGPLYLETTYDDDKSETATEPPVRTTTEAVRPSHHPPNDATTTLHIPGCGRKHSIKKIRTYVVGKHDAEEHWPWMAAIHVSRNGFHPRFQCGGSLITLRHVLTAAHCFDTRERDRDIYSVLLGTSNITTLPMGLAASPSGQLINVMNIRIHEQYIPGVYYDDIALLTLESKATRSNLISPVCLPSSYGMTSYSNPTMTGWGLTTFGGYASKILQETELQFIRFPICQRSYEEFKTKRLAQGITTDLLCAGFPTGGSGGCKGDSGGPLVAKSDGRWVQVGIVAFSVQCGEAGYPGVFTRVTAFAGWITRILSEYQPLI